MYPFILTTFAGLATLIGVLPIFVKINDKNKLIGSACAFASGVMVCVSVLDLIPESFRYLIGNYHCISLLIFVIISLLIGIMTSYFLEKIVDSVGSDNMLYKVGVLAMLVIIIHNIPEGIVTYVVSRKNIALGIPICIAIALHNVPEGISIAIPIYFATGNKFKAVIYTLISAMSELLGAIITSLFLTKYINNLILGLILSFTAGIMLQISINKLLPTSNSYCAENAKRYFIIGFIFMLISLLINNVVA